MPYVIQRIIATMVGGAIAEVIAGVCFDVSACRRMYATARTAGGVAMGMNRDCRVIKPEAVPAMIVAAEICI